MLCAIEHSAQEIKQYYQKINAYVQKIHTKNDKLRLIIKLFKIRSRSAWTHRDSLTRCLTVTLTLTWIVGVA